MWEWSFPLLSLVALYYGIPQSLGSQTYLWLVTPKGAPYIRCEPLGSEAGWWWDAADTVPISPEDLLERTSEKLGGRTSEGRADVWPTEALVLPGHEHARLRPRRAPRINCGFWFVPAGFAAIIISQDGAPPRSFTDLVFHF